MTENNGSGFHSEGNPTIEQRANNLTSYLTSFASSDTEMREVMFARMKPFLEENATREVLEALSGVGERNQELAQAMEAVFQNTSEEKNLWTGSGTVVLIGRDGTILGFHGVQPKDMSHYGGNFNFFAPALEKAMASLHLALDNKVGGLAAHSDYLKRIGYARHEGSPESSVVLNDGTELFVGGSGCEVNPVFNEEIPDPDNEGHFRLAGWWDQVFVEQVVKAINDPNSSNQIGKIIIPDKVISDPFYN